MIIAMHSLMLYFFPIKDRDLFMRIKTAVEAKHSIDIVLDCGEIDSYPYIQVFNIDAREDAEAIEIELRDLIARAGGQVIEPGITYDVTPQG